MKDFRSVHYKIDDVPRTTVSVQMLDPLLKIPTIRPCLNAAMYIVTLRATNHFRTLPAKQSLNWCVRTLATMTPPVRPRKFAPLNPEKKRDGDTRPVLKGIVFDVDGTLCLPQTYMFGEMRYVRAGYGLLLPLT